MSAESGTAGTSSALAGYSNSDAAGQVCFVIRRHKTNILLSDFHETDTVETIKKTINGILKFPVQDQRLYLLESQKESTAKPECPMYVGLVVRLTSGDFEQLSIQSLSEATQLPDVMNVSQFG